MADQPFPWLKLWHSYLDSPKIQSVTEALRARYVNLLCLACKFNQEGKLPPLIDIAFMIRLSEPDSQETLDVLVKHGMLERRGKSYWIHDWDQWQHQKSKAAVKQKRYRENVKSLRNVDSNALPTRDVTESNVLPRVRGEEEGEKDKEKKTRGGKPPAPPFSPPEWIPRTDWDGYIEMRRAEGKKLTPHAMQLLVNRLAASRSKGHDLATMLQNATIGGWSSVYEPDAPPRSNGHAKPELPLEYFTVPPGALPPRKDKP